MRLETDRLILRLPEHDDLDAYAAFFADPDVVRYTSGKTKTRAETARTVDRMLAHWDRYGIGLFSVVRKDDGRLLGRVGFLLWEANSWVHAMLRPPRGRVETEIGWMLGSEFWGRGYATEAALAARDWVLREHGLERLISLIQRGNVASVRVAEKLGETLEQVDVRGPFAAHTDLYSLTS